MCVGLKDVRLIEMGTKPNQADAYFRYSHSMVKGGFNRKKAQTIFAKGKNCKGPHAP